MPTAYPAQEGHARLDVSPPGATLLPSGSLRDRVPDGSYSLETTIRSRNTPNSLPLFTIANVQRIGQSHVYAVEIVESLVDALLRIDGLRGTGRLYLPFTHR